MALSDKEEARIRVETARTALDDDLATLSERLPAAKVVAGAGAAGGTGLALLGIAAKALQKRLDHRSQEKALTREAEVQARAIAAAIAAAGMHGPGRSTDDDGEQRQSRRPKVSVPVPPPTHLDDDSDDDSGVPWGLLFLLGSLVAAVVAMLNGKDDEDLWTTPGA